MVENYDDKEEKEENVTYIDGNSDELRNDD